MTDQAADGIQNMNIQDYEGSEFDPFGPQQTKMTNLQSNGSTDVDLIGNHSVDPEIPNGHSKLVSFNPEMNPELPDPSYLGQGQGEGCEVLQRNMSTGEILGFQNEYGESNITGQMEYEGYSDEEYGGNSRDYENGPPVLPDPQSDQDYYMSTGQPLVDFGSENVQSGGQSIGQGQPPMGDQQFVQQNTGDISSQVNDNEYEDAYDKSDIRESNPAYQAEAYNMDDDCDNDETEPSSWAPEMDAERARRSMSPERSVSPRDITSQSGADVISSPQYDTDSFADTGDLISSPLEMVQHPFQSDPHSFIPASDMIESPGRVLSPQPSVSESESSYSYADSKGSPRHKIPRPKKKKPTDLPPWDDNVVIPPLPHASSDSGVEEDKTAMSPRKSTHESKLKRYGTDCKNQAYKPGGGNVAIFDEKVEVKVGARTDTSRPKSVMSPRPQRSPSTPKPPTPNTRNVQSKIGSLNNVKHKPGGGDVAVLSTTLDFSTVRSKVGSKDKLDHKPKGGDKRIESQKLAWKAESKVGSLKNATHSPGGGNVKILDQKLDVKAQSKVGSTANLKHKPGGGDKKIEVQKLEFQEKAKSKVGSMDKVKHKPGGGDVKILDEKVDFSEKVNSKVGSLAKIKHQPGGGDVKIETQKLNFKETAKSRTNTGVGGEKSRSLSRTGSVGSSSQDDSLQG